MRLTRPVLLRLAAVSTLLFATGHMLGAVNSWSPHGETPTLAAMREFAFDVGGSRRTYWDFYYGFGIYIGVLLTMQAVLLWQLARVPLALAATSPLLSTMAVAWAIGTVVLWVYIFAVPAAFSTVCTALLIAARLRRDPIGGHSPPDH
jgi:hypothetical protein